MKRIKSPHDNKDRIICVAMDGHHDFYYQPVGSKARYWLSGYDFGGSVFDHFRSKGRNMEDRGFSLTICEFYRFHKWGNVKLAHQMERIPGQVDYVIQEYILGDQMAEKVSVPVRASHCERHDSYEYEIAG